MVSYFLRTARLGFRHWSESDFELVYALWSNAEVTRLIGGPFSRQWVEKRLAREMANQTALGIQYWPIFLLESNEHVGVCGLRPHLEDDVPALGYHLLPQFWGRGLATEASRAVIDYAFDTRHVRALFAGHHPDNVRSKRTLERLGFEYWRHDLYPPTGLQHPGYLLTQ
ncbi:MAG TPA: GNAT family N-acetyltransferase [Thermoanaerobaculia bacterium]|nr:GNAT family N-acetyltransferase [Thermoanaerobaculia bacterium]